MDEIMDSCQYIERDNGYKLLRWEPDGHLPYIPDSKCRMVENEEENAMLDAIDRERNNG